MRCNMRARNLSRGLMISFVVGLSLSAFVIGNKISRCSMSSLLLTLTLLPFISNGNVHRKNPYNPGFKSLFLLLVTCGVKSLRVLFDPVGANIVIFAQNENDFTQN